MYVGLILSALILMLLVFLRRKKVSFSIRVFLGMALGVLIGMYFKEEAMYLEPLGKAYINLIKMLVIPLVISSIITSITSLEDTNQLKKIGVKTLFWLVFTTFLACIVGLAVALILDPGAGVTFVPDASFKAREIPSFTKVLLDMVPSNTVAEAAEGKVIPVIIFALMVGVAASIESDKHSELIAPVKNFFKGFSQIMFRVTKMVLKLTPYGVFGLMSTVTSKYGLATLLPLGKLILAMYVACILLFVVVYSPLLAFVAKVNPIKFFKKIYPAQLVAFSTRSSYGTLPVTIKSLTDRVRISDKIANFVAPMGATMGLNACGGIYPVMVAIFAARIFNIPMQPIQYVQLILITTVASFGTAGVPGTASIMATVVLAAMGLPLQVVGMVLGVDVIIDMARTATNITGASVSALLVAASENEFNRDSFNNDADDPLELNM
ncbi:dicarboxylate/amino acid:cation symporter [Clostridium polynesiense]|uniref:dicarboxylate/amino acid:cation symporter n=1 Tax=Clostridium polynesiense TaxID=1325933 RepID=UPI00058B4BA4|nr:dicarboxylate/amino acid:cation symporter [Clostridium polynesiense]